MSDAANLCISSMSFLNVSSPSIIDRYNRWVFRTAVALLFSASPDGVAVVIISGILNGDVVVHISVFPHHLFDNKRTAFAIAG